MLNEDCYGLILSKIDDGLVYKSWLFTCWMFYRLDEPHHEVNKDKFWCIQANYARTHKESEHLRGRYLYFIQIIEMRHKWDRSRNIEKRAKLIKKYGSLVFYKALKYKLLSERDVIGYLDKRCDQLPLSSSKIPNKRRYNWLDRQEVNLWKSWDKQCKKPHGLFCIHIFRYDVRVLYLRGKYVMKMMRHIKGIVKDVESGLIKLLIDDEKCPVLKFPSQELMRSIKYEDDCVKIIHVY